MDVLKLTAIVIIGVVLDSVDSLTSKCNPMEAEVCKELSHEYNYTLFPNDFFTNQERSLEQFKSFDSLVKSKCSPVLTKFLCTYHFPPCTPQFTQHIWPCQELCEAARRDCEPVLKTYGHVWPSYLDCNKFPAQQPCVNTTSSSATASPTAVNDRRDTVSSTATPIPTPSISTPTIPVSLDPKCVKINSSTCAALHPKYLTYFPHKNYIYQDLAVLQFNSFQLLLTSNCSAKLKPFLCFSHFPACVQSDYADLQLIYPCKQLCKQVSKSCSPVLAKYNLSWPEHLNCDSFPSKSEKFCADSNFFSAMPQPTTTTTVSSSTLVPSPTTKPAVEGCQPIDSRVKEICGVVHETFSHTHFPHGEFSNQNEAYDEFVKLVPFIESNCSAELRAFLCYHYFPTCTTENPDELIKPCRSVCRKALTGCDSCLQNHSIQLPSCDDYKVKGSCLSLADIKNYVRNAAVNTMGCPVTAINASTTPTPSGCEDCRIKKLSKKSLLSSNYDYVARVRVLTQVASTEALYYSVKVQQFFHPSSKSANPVSIIHTQSSDDCPCVNLKVNREYLIAGYFKDNGILSLPSDGAVIERWENIDQSRVKELINKVYSN